MSLNAKLTLITALGVAFFLVIGLVEWRYYLVGSGEGFVERVIIKGGDALPRRFANVAIDLTHPQSVTGDNSLDSGRQTWGLSDSSSPAIVLFCFDRVGYLRQTLASLSELPGLEEVTLYISQDGNHSGVASVVNTTIHTALRARAQHAEHWQHDRQPLLYQNQVCPQHFQMLNAHLLKRKIASLPDMVSTAQPTLPTPICKSSGVPLYIL